MELLVTFSQKYFICTMNIILAELSALLKCTAVSSLLCVHWSVCDHFFRHQIVVVYT